MQSIFMNHYYVSFCNDLPTEYNCGKESMISTVSTLGSCEALSGPSPTKDAIFDSLRNDDENIDGLKISYKG